MSQHEPILYVDFDRTLFDTERFMEVTRRVIKKVFDVEISYDDAKLFFSHVDGLNKYDLLKHCESLGISEYKLRSKVIPELRNENTFLYDDALDIVMPYIILTYGYENNQQFKYDCVPELHDKEFIVVNEPKGEYLTRIYGKESVVLVDDKSFVFDGYDDFTLIHLNRAQTLPIVKDKQGVHIQSLEFLREVL